MHWRPEEASRDGSLMITDFDLAYSKRSKKWLLQCQSNVVDPQWDESLVSLVPLNGVGNYSLFFSIVFPFVSIFYLLKSAI